MIMSKRYVTLLGCVAALVIALGWAPPSRAHHYKGLPHYNYFDNYPQVPYLEFSRETPRYAVYMTVYNFQGLKREQVESPDVVRFYLYIYDLDADTVYKGKASFEILSDGRTLYRTGPVMPEQESIYVIEHKIDAEGDLVLRANVLSPDGTRSTVDVPFRLEKSFFQRYYVIILIVLFFVAVSVIKVVASRRGAEGRTAEEG